MGKLLPLILALVLGAFLYAGVERSRTVDPRDIPSPLINKPAPDFALSTVTNPDQEFTSSELKGQSYLLNVWASWCPACRTEHPFITDLSQSGEIPVYGLNWKDTRPEAQRWLDMFGDPYIKSGYDESGRVGIDFGVYGAPETFLIGPNGEVLHKHIGAMSPEIFDKDFRPHLKGRTGP